MQVQAHLNFNGRCEEAVEFYRKALGAEVMMLMRFKDMPNPQPGMVPPGSENKVMHSSFRIGESVLMAADTDSQNSKRFEGFALALSTRSEAEAEKVFNALADGGNVQMPLMKTFWSPKFGMVADRFGVSWMVNVTTDIPPK